MQVIEATTQDNDDFWGEPISIYTRAQALEDGFLIDVTETAKEAGIKFPLALTNAVWAEYVTVPKGVEFQDESGRLWDIIWMLKNAIKRSAGGQVLKFVVLVANNNRRARPIELKCVCGPGDNFEPVLTVMLPNEN